MASPTLVIAGKTSLAVNGAAVLRRLADERGLNNPILVVQTRGDDGVDGWQPSLLKFARQTERFEITDLESIYAFPELYFFSLEFDRLVRTDRTTSSNLFNIHFSLLPAYKGMSTSVLPILEGKDESGVTLHRIARGIDTGAIIAQRRFDIRPDDTSRDLYLNYLRHGAELFESQAGNLLDGTFTATPQSAIGSSYFSVTDVDYATPLTNFSRTAFELRNRIRAFTFVEYQLVTVDDLRVTTSVISDELSNSKPGTIVARAPGMRRIATIDYELSLFGIEISRAAPVPIATGRTPTIR